MGRLRIGTPEEAEERRRRLTADRVRRLRERRRAKTPASAGDPAAAEAPIPPATTARNAVADLATVMLGRFVETIERLETQLAGTRTRNPALADAYAAERRQVQAGLKAAWGEVEAAGFSVAATREVIRLRKMPVAERQELEATIGLYKQALGME